MTSTECKNCGAAVSDNFCAKCGQKTDTHRLTIPHIFHELIHVLTHADKSIFRFIKELTLNPSGIARDYITGKRKKYFNPVQFLFLVVAVSTFLSINFHLLTPAPDEGSVNSEKVKSFSEEQSQFSYKYSNLILFSSVPIGALFSFMFFRKRGYYYAENLILIAIITGGGTLLFIIFAPFFYYLKSYLSYVFILYSFIWVGYFIWTLVSFFEQRSFSGYLKAFTVVLLMNVVQVILSNLIFFLIFFPKG